MTLLWTRDIWPAPTPDDTLVDLLRRRAVSLPERIVYHLLDDDFFDSGVVSGRSMTYEDVDCQARAIAAALQAKKIGAGRRVLLLYAPGLEFIAAFFGCLYAGTVPVPAYPPQAGLSLDPLRPLRALAGDCTPAIAMTGGVVASSVQELCDSDATLARMSWLTNDAVDIRGAVDWQPPQIDSESVALLQYTSGSTGHPRGVEVSHRNILDNEYILQLAFNHMTHIKPGVGVCWLPFHHDMGLIGSVLQAVYVDGPCYFLSPLQFLRKPVRWLQAITHLAPLTPYSSGGPNFAYELCALKVTEEQKQSLDLSQWKVAYIGAEAISANTIRRFSAAFESCGFDPAAFYPCYGLAESTLFVTGGDYGTSPTIRSFVEVDGWMLPETDLSRVQFHAPEESDRDLTPKQGATRTLVGCGWPWQGHEVVIVNPTTRVECPRGMIGEIWVAGPSVAKGYRNRSEETEDTFQALISGSNRGPFMRTGDLGFLSEGELFISGRLKELIIIRGRNYSPEDIEATIRSMHVAFRPNSGAAFSVERNGEERLVVLQEIDRSSRQIDVHTLTEEVRQRIAEEHQLQLMDIVFLRNGTIPKTTSGKIRRLACREMYESGQLTNQWKGRGR